MINIDVPIFSVEELQKVILKADTINVDPIGKAASTMTNKLVNMMYMLIAEKGIEKEKKILQIDNIDINREIIILATVYEKLLELLKSLKEAKVNEEMTLRNIKYDRFGNYIVCGLEYSYIIMVKGNEFKYGNTSLFSNIEKMNTICKSLEKTDELITRLVTDASQSVSRSTTADYIAKMCKELIDDTEDKFTKSMELIDLHRGIVKILKGE